MKSRVRHIFYCLCMLAVVSPAFLFPVQVQATTTPPLGSAAVLYQNLPDEANYTALLVAKEMALVRALGGFTPQDATKSDAVTQGMALVTATDKAGQGTELSVLEYILPGVVSTLSVEGSVPSTAVSQAVNPLSTADMTLLNAHQPISISAATFIQALNDLLTRQGAAGAGAPLMPTSTLNATLSTLLTNYLNGNLVATPTPTATQIITTPPVYTPAPTPAAATVSPLVLLLPVAVVLFAFLFLYMRRKKRSQVLPKVAQNSVVTYAVLDDEFANTKRRLASISMAVDVTKAVVREALQLVEADSVSFLRNNAGTYSLVNSSKPDLLATKFIGDGFIERIGENGVPIIQENSTQPLIRYTPMALAAVPLVSHSRIEGVLLLLRGAEHSFTPKEGETLAKFASIAAEAIYKAEVTQKAVEQSLVDELTRVGNRRRMDNELMGFYSDENMPLSLVMFGVDGMEHINDTYGREYGDEVLKGVATLIYSTTRPTDSFYRFEEDVFCLLMPETPADVASLPAERMRKLVEGHKFLLSNSQTLNVTISAGVASAAIGETDTIFARAAASLQEAKIAGRNQTKS